MHLKKNLEKRKACVHVIKFVIKVCALFAENKVRFARAELYGVR